MTGEESAEARNIIRGGVFLGPVVQGREIQANFYLPAAAPLALAQLPPETTGFSGRDDELAVLAEVLNPAGTSGTAIVSVAGLAGVGKTTLAIEAAHAVRARGWFDGGVLFIDLHGYDARPVEPSQALDTLLRALGIPAEHIPPGEEERAGLYRSVLAAITEPVLVMADNASSEAQVKPLLPGTGRHKVMVTSRHTLAGLSARLIDATVLDDKTASAVMDVALRTARPDDDRITCDRETAGRLAQLCGGLPLALQITAALLKADPALSTIGLAVQLADEKDRLAALRYDDGGQSAPSVAAAFELSYHRLDDTVARVFRLLPANPGPDVSTAAAAMLADLPVSQVRQALRDLMRAHLVETTPGSADRWRMHDLIRLYARQLGGSTGQADDQYRAADRLLHYYLDSANAADDDLGAARDATAPGRLADRNDALAWLDGELNNLLAAVSFAAETGRDEIAQELPLALTGYLELRRRFDDLMFVSNISATAAHRLQNSPAQASALASLGRGLMGMRRFDEAITALQDTAIILHRTSHWHAEAAALNILGVALQHARRLNEAITVHQTAARISRDIGDRHGEGMALTNLGDVLSATQQSDEAITALRDAAAIFREIGDRHGEGAVLNNIGKVLAATQQFDEAIIALQDAAAVFRETEDQYREGRALTNLGRALHRARRFDEAIIAHQKAAAIYRAIPDRHAEGDALGNLGAALGEQRRLDDAITAHRGAAAIYRETDDRHSEGTALDNLGLALLQAHRFDEAITALQDATASYHETGDPDGEGDALDNLGLALALTQRFDEAIIAHQDAAAIYHETVNRSGEAAALSKLGLALVDVRRFEQAITAYQDAAMIFREIGDRRGEGGALNELGKVLQQAQRFDEAITAHHQNLLICLDTGDLHSIGSALLNFGSALLRAGQFDKAVDAFRDAAASFKATEEPRSEGVAQCWLGVGLGETRRFDEAITALEKAGTIFHETGDSEDEDWALRELHRVHTEMRI